MTDATEMTQKAFFGYLTAKAQSVMRPMPDDFFPEFKDELVNGITYHAWRHIIQTSGGPVELSAGWPRYLDAGGNPAITGIRQDAAKWDAGLRQMAWQALEAARLKGYPVDLHPWFTAEPKKALAPFPQKGLIDEYAPSLSGGGRYFA